MTSKINFFIIFIAIIAGLGGFLSGFDSSIMADVQDQLVAQLGLNNWQRAQLVSISVFGCILGIPLSGLIADKINRQSLVKIVAIAFILSAIQCVFSQGFYTI